jgi:uncharacterized protein (DUF58 family)
VSAAADEGPVLTSDEWRARRRAQEAALPDVERQARRLLRRARMRPTGRGWGAIVLGVVAVVAAYVLGRSELLVVGAAAILLPVIGLVVVRMRAPRFEVLRIFAPPIVAAGETVQVRVRIHSTGRGEGPALLWNDAIPWREDDQAPRTLDPIRTGATLDRVREVEYRLHPPRRGVYAIGPLVVEHRDPFGMAARVAALGEQDRLLVIPAVAQLSVGGPSLADGEGAAQLVQRRITGNDDDLTTREYRSGDALRRVHWRASARHGELMVRQEEHRSHPDARLLIDTRLAGYPDAVPDAGSTWDEAAGSEAFEWVVRMAASLGLHLEANGFDVAVEETGPAQIDPLGERWEGGRRTEGFLTSLAGVRLLEQPLRTSVPVEDARGPVFAMVGDPDDATVDWLVRHRRGAQLAVVFLVDARDAAIEHLAEAGWTVIPVTDRSGIAEAWAVVARPDAAREAGDGAH